MAVAVKTSGSQTTSGTTEHDLATVTDPGVYALALDLANLVAGATQSILRVREYMKARSGDTERLLKEYSVSGAQSEPLFVTVPRISPVHIRYTVTMIQGSNQTIPWAVYNT